VNLRGSRFLLAAIAVSLSIPLARCDMPGDAGASDPANLSNDRQSDGALSR
jgi:hypothetical protein